VRLELSRLTPLEPDPDHADRVRRRCRARIARQAQRTGRREPDPLGALVVPLLLGVVCLIYGVAFLSTALGLEEIFR
jgi:hypothetical protein